jgi:hypothetical protein
MDKKIKYLKIFFPVIFIVSFLLSACVDDYGRHNYDNYNFGTSLGLIQTSTTGVPFLVNLDNGSILTPSDASFPGFTPLDSQRVWVRFNPLSNTNINDSTFNYVGKIYDIQNILFKDIKNISQVKSDSVGHDEITVKNAWIQPKDILNLDLRFFTNGSVHYINLIDNGKGDGITNPFVLELRHNARGDNPIYPAYATVSFKLNYLRKAGKNPVSFFISYTDYNGNQIQIPKTYSY